MNRLPDLESVVRPLKTNGMPGGGGGAALRVGEQPSVGEGCSGTRGVWCRKRMVWGAGGKEPPERHPGKNGWDRSGRLCWAFILREKAA